MLDRERRAVPFDPLKDFQFLSSEEMGEYECGEEYRRFLAAFREEYVYEMMRLSEETTPFRTLGHIAGVHYIAMTVARGIREAGENVDLALVSAAAAAHDLGKFGCRPGSVSRSSTTTTPTSGCWGGGCPPSATSLPTTPPGTWSWTPSPWSPCV